MSGAQPGRPNVLLVHPYRLGTAGLTTFVLGLQKGLRAQGCGALVLVGGDSSRVTVQDEAAQIYQVYLRRVWPETGRLRALVAFWVRLPITLLHLWQFLRRERIDVVHLHFTNPASLYFAVLRPLSGWRLITTFHGTDAYSLPRRTPWHRFLVRLVIGAADALTTVSADLLLAVKAAYPRLRTPARVILNGSLVTDAPSTAAPPPGLPDRYALAVGSLIPRKAYDVLVRALRLVRDRGRDLHLVIVGGGPEDTALVSLAQELGISDRVVLAGEMPHAAALGFYAGARFFVHSAREEAFGLVMLEAMSFGKAVIAARVGGIPEFVRDGVTGLLVEADDPEALAEAMATLDADEALRAKLGAAGREAASTEHSWDRVVERYRGLYEDVLRRP
ncbi:MAG TPA: glycosyltransferase family 4 protein [Candidatus Limnocylindrales bacterium]|nr:glycosyltransferase family 4 protein [Candidatus Limnocylindrales bacterium]